MKLTNEINKFMKRRYYISDFVQQFGCVCLFGLGGATLTLTLTLTLLHSISTNGQTAAGSKPFEETKP